MQSQSLLLPPGFKFRPTSVQMAKFFLKKKALGQTMATRIIPQDFHLIFSTHPQNLPGDPNEKHRYYFCRKSEDQVTKTSDSIWTPTGFEANVLDPAHNSDVIGILRQYKLTNQDQEDDDEEDDPKHYWLLEEISLPSTIVVTDWVICHVARKKIKPKPCYFTEEEDESEPESEPEKEDETKPESEEKDETKPEPEPRKEDRGFD